MGGPFLLMEFVEGSTAADADARRCGGTVPAMVDAGPRPFRRAGRVVALVAAVSLAAGCARDEAEPAPAPATVAGSPPSSSLPLAPTVAPGPMPAGPAGSSSPELTLPPTTLPTPAESTSPTSPVFPTPSDDEGTDSPAEPDVLRGISMTSVPTDVIIPSDASSIDPETNPINGRRARQRSVLVDLDCERGSAPPDELCYAAMLDHLGLDVTSGPDDDRERRIRRATAVVQLDAGLPVTGVPDDELLDYLGATSDSSADREGR